MKESAVRFGAWRSLVGVVRDPDEAGNPDAPAVLFLNAGLLHHVGPHRLHVKLARRLGAKGVRTLRFDLSGIGDSGPRQDRMGREESIVRETQEAMDFMAASYGTRRFVLFGICAGADQAVRTALTDDRVVGVSLVDAYAYPTKGHVLHYYAGRMLHGRSWWNVLSGQHPGYRRVASRLFGRHEHDDGPSRAAAPRPGVYLKPPRAEAEQRLGALVDRGCQLCCIYTPSVNYSHAGQFAEMFPGLAGRSGIDVVFLEGSDHVFTLLASQAELMDAVETWFERAGGPTVAPTPSP